MSGPTHGSPSLLHLAKGCKDGRAGTHSTQTQLTPVQPLFAALSRCSALHASLLPDGTPNNFFGLADDSEDEEDGDNDDDAADGEIGRVRSDFHSGGGPDARYRPY